MDNATVIDQSTAPVSQLSLSGVLQIPAIRQAVLLVGVAAAVAAGFAIVLWSQTPGYTQLYVDLSAAEAADVAEALTSANIQYKLENNTGSIMVPKSVLHEARMQLASQGLPQNAAAGMAAIQEQSSFGTSQFMENARYQHALEAELGRTIASMGSVREARVHLALPKQTSFINDRKSASASVLLQLFRGRSLEADQASAIVNLVASSVPNLRAKNVTVIDQHGTLLSTGDQPAADARANTQFKYRQRLEESYQRRIVDLLTPLVGAGRVRAQIVADLDFTVTEETRESFDPASTVVRSEQISEEERRGGANAAAGVPGALSNQPPQTAESTTAADQSTGAESTAQSQEPLNSSRAATRNFEVDRTISHTRPQTGVIRKLSVAVLVDDSPVEGEDDQAALTDAEVARYTELVQKAVGFDAARGDTVVVVNAAFKTSLPVEALEEPAFWEKPLLRDIMKQLLGAAIALAIAFGIVRPLLRGVLASSPVVSAEYLGNAAAYAADGSPVHLSGGPAAIPPPNYDEKVAAAKNITGHDPARVAQVVKKWVAVDE